MSRPRVLPPKSFVFYEGISLLDGKPIVGIATGLRQYAGGASENAKTGKMVQTWIMRSDVKPNDALHTGQDKSVCGHCPLRPYLAKGTGKPLCYATCSGGRGTLLNIYLSYKEGRMLKLPLLTAQEALCGKKVRLGAYGDPTAIPYDVWGTLLDKVFGHIGYTHQWRTCDYRWSDVVMASVDSEEERIEAKRLGWRTFRIRESGDSVQPKEVVCPGSVEAGKILTCEQCMACNGTWTERKGDIVVMAHGSGRQTK